MVIAVFRKETDKLASVCTKKFRNEIAAKKHIEEDAARICMLHSALDLGWIKPKTLDYYCIEMKNGTKCYWQYFNI